MLSDPDFVRSTHVAWDKLSDKPDFSCMDDNMRNFTMANWLMLEPVKDDDICSCPEGQQEGKFYKDCCKDWWEKFKASIPQVKKAFPERE